MNAKYLRHLLLLGVTVLGASLLALPAAAQLNVRVRIQLPPLLIFASPPELVVIPQTYVYVVPDVSDDIYFYDGYWWRPWQGRWYRSHYYDRGWAYYSSVPVFYRDVPSDWRDEYRERDWRGRSWNYERINHHEVENNWKGWKRDGHWEKNGTWGVNGMDAHAPRVNHYDRGPQPPSPAADRSDRGPQHPSPAADRRERDSQPNTAPPENRGPQPQGPNSVDHGNQGDRGQGNSNKSMGNSNKGKGHGNNSGRGNGGHRNK
jgi:hypothetical protein